MSVLKLNQADIVTRGLDFVPINRIQRDGGTQARGKLDPEHLERLIEALEAGNDFPAITVFYDGNTYWLADGFHRVEAYCRSKGPNAEIVADVIQGDRRAAVLYSVGANNNHGLPRKREDVRRSIETLLRDPEWVKWSDREIARRVVCSHTYVANVRAQMVSTGNLLPVDSRIGADGKERAMPAPKPAKPLPASSPTPLPVSPPNKPDRVCQECGGNNPYDFYPSRPETSCPGCYQLYTAKTHKALMLEVRRKYLLEAFQWHWDRPGLMKQIIDVADTFGIDLSQAETKWFPKLPNGFRWIRSGAGVVQVERLANGLHTRNLYLDALKDGVAWANEQATRPITWGHAPAVTLEQRVERIKTSNDPQSAVALELLELLISSRRMEADEGGEDGDEADETEDDAGMPVSAPTPLPAPVRASASEGPLTDAELSDLSLLGGWEREAAISEGKIAMRMCRGENWDRVETRSPSGWRYELVQLRHAAANAEDLGRREAAVIQRANVLGYRVTSLIGGGYRLMRGDVPMGGAKNLSELSSYVDELEQQYLEQQQQPFDEDEEEEAEAPPVDPAVQDAHLSHVTAHIAALLDRLSVTDRRVLYLLMLGDLYEEDRADDERVSEAVWKAALNMLNGTTDAALEWAIAAY